MNFKNNKVRKVVHHVSTRWLSLGTCLETTLMHCDSFKQYVLSNFDLDDDHAENDQDEKPT